MTVSTENQQAPESAATEAQPSLQISDMILMLKIIQVTAQRGAVRAEEMAEVGSLHDRLFKFLVSTGALQQPAPAPEENQNG